MAKEVRPSTKSIAFTEAELFIDSADLDKESVKITPIAVTWTENKGSDCSEMSRVTGKLIQGGTAYFLKCDCAVTDKTNKLSSVRMNVNSFSEVEVVRLTDMRSNE